MNKFAIAAVALCALLVVSSVDASELSALRRHRKSRSHSGTPCSDDEHCENEDYPVCCADKVKGKFTCRRIRDDCPNVKIHSSPLLDRILHSSIPESDPTREKNIGPDGEEAEDPADHEYPDYKKCYEGQVVKADDDEGIDFGGVSSCMTIVCFVKNQDGSFDKYAAHQSIMRRSQRLNWSQVFHMLLAKLDGKKCHTLTVTGVRDMWTSKLTPNPERSHHSPDNFDDNKVKAFLSKKFHVAEDNIHILPHSDGRIVVSPAGRVTFYMPGSSPHMPPIKVNWIPYFKTGKTPEMKMVDDIDDEDEDEDEN